MDFEGALITRHVKVDRSRTAAQAIEATGRAVVSPSATFEPILATASMEGPEEVDVHFFGLDYDPTPIQLAVEYETRGLKPDLAAQAAVNEDDPVFADERPNGLQWVSKRGESYFVLFFREEHEYHIHLWDSDHRWRKGWLFGGVRK